jgi:hypothetical protein
MALVSCVVALAAVVALHHMEMPEGDHGMGHHATSVMVMCLGIVGTAVLAVAALPHLGRFVFFGAALVATLTDTVLVSAGAYPTRAGPALFLRLSVLRR